MPGIYHQAGCCCSDPCTDCGHDYCLYGTGSVANYPDCSTGASGVCSFCNDVQGTYEASNRGSFSNEDDYCEWESDCDGVGGPTLSVVYWKSTKTWYAIVHDYDNKAWVQANGKLFFGDIAQTGGPAYVKYYKDVTGDVSCDADGPELTGAFSLAGAPCDSPGLSCEGCTLTVTLS